MPGSLLFVLYLLFFVALTWSFRFFRLPGLPRWVAPFALLIKLAAGSGLAWIYSHHYHDRSTADVFKLYDDAKVIYGALDQHPKDYFNLVCGLDGNSPYYDRYYNRMQHWFPEYESAPRFFNDTQTMIRLNALVMVFSRTYYPIHILFWCFFALIGLVLLYRVFYAEMAHKPWLLYLGVLGVPSVLAWGSGVLKESWVLLGMGMVLSAWMNGARRGFGIKSLMLLALGVLCFLLVKVHVFLAMMPALIAYAIAIRKAGWRVAWVFTAVIATFIVMFAVSRIVFPQTDLLAWMAQRQQSLLRVALYTDSGSVVFVNPLDPRWSSLLRNLPEALLNAFFRPWITEAKGSLSIMAALENFGLALLMLLTALFHEPLTPLRKALVWFCWSFALILFAFMGLTTPILGTLVRYRMPGLLLLVLGLLVQFDPKAFVTQMKIWFRYDT